MNELMLQLYDYIRMLGLTRINNILNGISILRYGDRFLYCIRESVFDFTEKEEDIWNINFIVNQLDQSMIKAYKERQLINVV